jgi:hypothetical protein
VVGAEAPNSALSPEGLSDCIPPVPRSSFTRQQQAIAQWTGSRPRHLAAAERHPKSHKEKPLIVRGYDCTTLYRQELRKELLRNTRHLPPGAQRVARALAADVTIENRWTIRGDYFWSQKSRLSKRARLSRQWTGKYLKLLAENGLVEIPEQQRKYNHPKTLSLPAKLLQKAMQKVIRAVEIFISFNKGDTSERSERSPHRTLRLKHILRSSPGGPSPPQAHHSGKLPSLEEALGLFGRKRRRGSGAMSAPAFAGPTVRRTPGARAAREAVARRRACRKMR